MVKDNTTHQPANIHILKLSLSSLPPASHLSLYERPLICVDSSAILTRIHLHEAKMFQKGHLWHNPRLASVGIELRKHVGHNTAFDLMLLLDGLARRMDDGQFQSRIQNLQQSKYSSSPNLRHEATSLLSDLCISNIVPPHTLRREYKNSYMKHLSGIWLSRLTLDLEDIYNSPVGRLLNLNSRVKTIGNEILDCVVSRELMKARNTVAANNL